jgi:cell division protein FtsN
MKRWSYFYFVVFLLGLAMACGCSSGKPKLGGAESVFYKNMLRGLDPAELKAMVKEKELLKMRIDELEMERIMLFKINQSLEADIKKSYAHNKRIMEEMGLTSSTAQTAPMNAAELLNSIASDTGKGEVVRKSVAAAKPAEAVEVTEYYVMVLMVGSEKKKLQWVKLGSFKEYADAKDFKARLIQAGLAAHRLKISNKA